MWNQVYDPFNNATASTIAAALPVVTLLVLIASNKVKAHIAAIVALIVANVVAIFIFTMPANMSLRANRARRSNRIFPDRLDCAQRHLPLPPDGGERGVSRRCRTRSAASPMTAGCSFCSLPSRSARSSRARRALERRLQ
jgi:L-lactate permease